MKDNSKIRSVYENRTLLIYIVAGIMILYGIYRQIQVFSVGLEFFTLSIAWYVSVINILVIVIGIGIIRLKVYGWFGGSSLFLILFLINFLVVLCFVIYAIFNKSLVQLLPALKNITSTKVTFNSEVLFSIVKIFVYGIILKLLSENDVIEGYGLDKFKKIILCVLVFFISIIAFCMYLGAYWLISL